MVRVRRNLIIPDTYWPNSTPFKSPDLIELNSDSEKNVKPGNEHSVLSSLELKLSSLVGLIISLSSSLALGISI